jgi:hypothetical protein
MEVVGHMVFNKPYANVYALAIEPTAIPYPIEEQQCFKGILQSIALQLTGRHLASILNPSQGGSARPK